MGQKFIRLEWVAIPMTFSLCLMLGTDFFFQNNQIPQTILLVSQDFEIILVSNKSSAENSILLCEIVLRN